MKTKILFFAFVVLLISATAYATETPKTEILSVQDNKILVSYQTEKPSLFEITITDNNGVVLHEWKPENPQTCIKKLFNLKELEDGTYQLSVKLGIKSLNLTFNIDGKKIAMGPLCEHFEPYFNFKNDKLYVSFLNQSTKHVYLNIYKNGEHYTGFDLGKKFDVQKCFDFSIAKKGNYEIVLTDNVCSHNFTITR